jgi:outer membrane protein insertion porin family
MKKTITSALIAGALLTSSVFAKEFAPFVVKDIKVVGLERIELGTFLSYLPLEVGEIVDPVRLPRLIRALYKERSFDDIKVSKDGNALIFVIKERPIIASITFDGNKDIKTEQLEEAMRGAGIYKGEVFNPSIISSMEKEIEAQYYANGKYSVNVKARISTLPRNRVAIALKVKEGKAAAIQRINIVGNNTFSEEDLLDTFESSSTNWTSWISSDDQYAKQTLNGDIETLTSFYNNRGYINFQITSTQVSLTPDKQNVYVTINIDEGKKYEVNDIKFSGELIFDLEFLESFMPLAKGDTFSQALLTQYEEAVSTQLGYRGYAFAKVMTNPVVDDEDNIVDLNIFINPGQRTYVRRINFIGNHITSDETLRREMRLWEQGPLSTGLVERSKTRLTQRLEFIEKVEVETVPVVGTDDMVDLNFSVKERDNQGQFQGGISYGNRFASLFFQVSHNNFLGEGKRVGASINLSDFQKSVEGRYSNPYFTDDEVSQSYSAYYKTTDFNQIRSVPSTKDSVGFDVGFGFPINEFNYLNFGAGVEVSTLKTGQNARRWDQIDELYESQGKDPSVNNEIDFNLFKLKSSWRYNSLNRSVFPDRGSSHTIRAEATVPGSDIEFYKFDYEFNQYWPITNDGWSFRVRSKLAYGSGYGATEKMPYFENYYIRGNNKIRGFDRGNIGPPVIYRYSSTTSIPSPIPGEPSIIVELPDDFDTLDVSTRQSVGGNALAVGTLELFFPVPFMEQSSAFRSSIYADIGSTWDTKFDKSLRFGNLALEEQNKVFDYSSPERYRASYGFAFNWLSPMGPIMISWSKPIKQYEGDDHEVISFEIGQVF